MLHCIDSACWFSICICGRCCTKVGKIFCTPSIARCQSPPLLLSLLMTAMRLGFPLFVVGWRSSLSTVLRCAARLDLTSPIREAAEVHASPSYARAARGVWQARLASMDELDAITMEEGEDDGIALGDVVPKPSDGPRTEPA